MDRNKITLCVLGGLVKTVSVSVVVVTYF
jgi:hypothetical protein